MPAGRTTKQGNLMPEYRWAPASGQEIPSDACEKGHGWEYERPDDSNRPQVALWAMRTIADPDPFGGAVRVCPERALIGTRRFLSRPFEN